MEAIEFPQVNRRLGPPKGMTEEQCFTLPVCISKDSEGKDVVLSCWKLSDEELEKLKVDGVIWLGILGTNMQPVYLTIENPFINEP
jgi:hypothetical protein